MARRPKAVALNVIGTLFSLDPVEEKMQEARMIPGSLKIWFPRVLRDGFGLAAAGSFKPFSEVAAGALEGLMSEQGLKSKKSKLASVLGTFAKLPAHPDVGSGLRTLRAAKLRIIALTNGSSKTTKKLLSHAELDEYFDEIISIDDIGHWKPSAAVYRHAAKVAGVAAQEMALIAAHDWDIDGASRAGLTTGYIARKQPTCSPAMQQPDVRGDTLPETVEALLALRA